MIPGTTSLLQSKARSSTQMELTYLFGKIADSPFELKADHIYDATTKRLGACMRRLGWLGPKKMRFAIGPKQGYWRQKPST